MSSFRPTRTSSSSKLAILGGRAGHKSNSDISRSSAVSNSELQALTQKDIEFLDAVIQRASPSATTFLTVFKAYNDILNERGMDPQNEVVYYGKLLKIGTLKGTSWGDKWMTVKLQQGYSRDLGSQKSPARVGDPPTPVIPSTPIMTRLTTRDQEDDLFTLHSHQDDSEVINDDAATETEIDLHKYSQTSKSILRRPLSEQPFTSIRPSVLESASLLGPGVQVSILPIRNSHPWESVSDATETCTPSTIPPSYGAAVRDAHVYRTLSSKARPRSSGESPCSVHTVAKPKLHTRQQGKSWIDEDDAWTKVKMLQDEKEANRFRDDRLIESCWALWRSGIDWIIVRCYVYSILLCVIILLTDDQ
jgi:protein SFI1